MTKVYYSNQDYDTPKKMKSHLLSKSRWKLGWTFLVIALSLQTLRCSAKVSDGSNFPMVSKKSVVQSEEDVALLANSNC